MKQWNALPWAAFASALAAMLLPSCSAAAGPGPDASMHVAIELPEFPAVWSKADAWELSWVSSDGTGSELDLAPGAVADVRLPRLREAALLCSARFGNSRSLPYGAVWPLDWRPDGTVSVSAIGGYAAALAAVLYRAGCTCCGLDLRRFAQEAAARLADPWDVDPAALAPVAAERRFSVDYLRQPAMVEVAVDGIGCAMVPDSPWSAVVVPDGSGHALVRVACGGIRRWYGGGYELVVGVSVSGVPSWTLGPDSSGMPMQKVLPEPSMLVTEASPP